MSDGVQSFRVMVRNAKTEEVREYTLPVDGPQLIADLIESIPNLDPSRRVAYNGAFAGSLAAAIHGGTAGYVGEFLELRKLDGPPPLTLVGELADDDPAEHELGCNCLFCIPGV